MTVVFETLAKEQLGNSLFGQSDEHIHWLTSSTGIHKAMVAAFIAMQNAAQQDNVDLAIASGFRDFTRQLTLWNNKLTGKAHVKNINNDVIDLTQLPAMEKVTAVMLFSAIPGLSRHHWGTDIDVYSPSSLTDNQCLQLECWEYESNGPMAKLSQWLSKHANHFGFYFPYQQYRNGVAPEPWHLSFWPLAEQYQRQLTPEKFTGFIANKKCTDIAYIETILENLPMLFNNFVHNIHQPCSLIKGHYYG